MMTAISTHLFKFAAVLSLLVLSPVPTRAADDSASSTLTIRNAAGEKIAVLGSQKNQTLTVQTPEGTEVILRADASKSGLLVIQNSQSEDAVIVGINKEDPGKLTVKRKGETDFAPIVTNVAKGIAIVIALLVIRAIIGAIGRGVKIEFNEERKSLELRLKDLERKLKEMGVPITE